MKEQPTWTPPLPRFQLGWETVRPGPQQIRLLARFVTVIRWPGLAFVAVVGMVAPPRTPILLALLIVWVALYNAWAMHRLRIAPDHSVLGISRTLMLLDELTYFGLLIIFAGYDLGIVFACYLLLLMAAVAYDGAEGAMLSVAIFVLGMTLYQTLRLVVFKLPFSSTDLLLWSLIMAVAGTTLAAIDGILLEGGRGAQAAAQPADSKSPGETIHLSPREHEVLRLVSEGYSNTMIASRLHLSENTIKTYMEGLLTRLHARNRAEAVAAASRHKLL